MIGVEDILETLANNDMRFEVMFTALFDIIKEKKGPDGQPFVTEKEFVERVSSVQKKLMEDMATAKQKSSIIRPDGIIH